MGDRLADTVSPFFKESCPLFLRSSGCYSERQRGGVPEQHHQGPQHPRPGQPLRHGARGAQVQSPDTQVFQGKPRDPPQALSNARELPQSLSNA